MANHKSSKKRARQSERKKIQNKSYLSMVKSAVKSYQTAIDELKQGKGDKNKALGLFKTAQSVLQKAATKGILHKNNASRRVGRLYGQFASLSK